MKLTITVAPEQTEGPLRRQEVELLPSPGPGRSIQLLAPPQAYGREDGSVVVTLDYFVTEDAAPTRERSDDVSAIRYVVQWRGEYGNGDWRKVRGVEGGPWISAGRAYRIAVARSRDTGSSHRVTARKVAA